MMRVQALLDTPKETRNRSSFRSWLEEKHSQEASGTVMHCKHDFGGSRSEIFCD